MSWPKNISSDIIMAHLKERDVQVRVINKLTEILIESIPGITIEKKGDGHIYVCRKCGSTFFIHPGSCPRCLQIFMNKMNHQKKRAIYEYREKRAASLDAGQNLCPQMDTDP